MFKISRGEKRSLLEGFLLFFVLMALVFGYQALSEPLFLARQNHLLGAVAMGLAAVGVLLARLQMR